MLGAATVYRGPYSDWAQARAATVGYQYIDILARVRKATECVLRGEAEYEQDGLAMRGPVPASHALEALMLIAALEGGRLSVLDFGGGLGSHFLRWRKHLARIPHLHWRVVEQQHFVDAGKELFAGNQQLSFTTAIAVADAPAPNAIVASSVLQYLADPLSTLDELIALRARGMIVDRTPLREDRDALILSQHVPKSLGRASYPLWLLSRKTVHSRLHSHYELLTKFSCEDAPLRSGRIRGEYAGSTWLRRE